MVPRHICSWLLLFPGQNGFPAQETQLCGLSSGRASGKPACPLGQLASLRSAILISALKSPPFPEAKLCHPHQLAQPLRDHISSLTRPQSSQSPCQAPVAIGGLFLCDISVLGFPGHPTDALLVLPGANRQGRKACFPAMCRPLSLASSKWRVCSCSHGCLWLVPVLVPLPRVAAGWMPFGGWETFVLLPPS